MSEAPELGPIDYLVVEYAGQPTGEALPHLLQLVDSGTIRILDIALIRRGPDGVETLRPEDLAAAGAPEFEVFVGAASGLVDDADLAEVAQVLTEGALGLLLVYENSWAAPFATALRRAGGSVVAGGRIRVEDILEVLGDSA